MSLGRRPVVYPGMAAFPVVEDFDVFEQRRLGPGTGAELRSMNQLGLDRAEERFHRCIDAPIKVKGPIERPELISVGHTGSRISPSCPFLRPCVAGRSPGSAGGRACER